MALSQEEIRGSVAHWIKLNEYKFTCPFCKTDATTWKIGIICDLLTSSPEHGKFSVIPLVCASCPYTIFLSVPDFLDRFLQTKQSSS